MVVSFAMQEISFAAGATGVSSISVPASMAQVEKKEQRPGAETVIHIQDAHDSLEAQKKITGILGVLAKDYDIRSVALEGSSGDIDPLIFKSYPDASVAEAAAAELLKEGHLNAGEFFAVTTKEPVAVYGAEERTLYRENLKVFRDVLRNKETVRPELERVSRTIERLTERVYSKETADFKKKALSGVSASGDISGQWVFLKEKAKTHHVPIADYPELVVLDRIAATEASINFTKANAERDALLSVLRQRLDADSVRELVRLSLEYKAGTVLDSEFHSALFERAGRLGLPTEPYPNLSAYVGYTAMFDKLDLAKVLDELERFEDRLLEASFKNADERVLHGIEKNWKLLRHLLEGEASSAEFDIFRNEPGRFAMPAFRDALKTLGDKNRVSVSTDAQWGTLYSALPVSERFYVLAEKRNQVMLENTLKRMRSEGKQAAVLVTGGFHAAGILNALQDKKLSYLVLMPKLSENGDKRPYVTVLSRKAPEYAKEYSSPASRFTIAFGAGMDSLHAAGTTNFAGIVKKIAANGRVEEWMANYRRGWKGPQSSPHSPDKVEAIVGVKGARLAELIEEVDLETGRPSGRRVTFDQAHESGIWHAGSQLILASEDGNVLLQFTDHDNFDWSAAGHVAAGETNEAAVIREAKEEIGVNIKISDLKRVSNPRNGKPFFVKDGSKNYQAAWGYDARDIFLSASFSAYDRQIDQLFIVVLTNEQLKKIKADFKPTPEVKRVEIESLSDLVNRVAAERQNFTTGIAQYLYDPKMSTAFLESVRKLAAGARLAGTAPGVSDRTTQLLFDLLTLIENERWDAASNLAAELKGQGYKLSVISAKPDVLTEQGLARLGVQTVRPVENLEDAVNLAPDLRTQSAVSRFRLASNLYALVTQYGSDKESQTRLIASRTGINGTKFEWVVINPAFREKLPLYRTMIVNQDPYPIEFFSDDRSGSAGARSVAPLSEASSPDRSVRGADVVDVPFSGSYAQTYIIERNGHYLVHKEASGAGYQKLLDELNWLQALTGERKRLFPEMVDHGVDPNKVWFEIRYYPWPTITQLLMWGAWENGDGSESWSFLKELYGRLLPIFGMVQIDETPADFFERFHRRKIKDRLEETRAKAPSLGNLIDLPVLTIDGRKAVGALPLLDLIEQADRERGWLRPPFLSMTHGDLNQGNILVDPANFEEGLSTVHVKLIDPRGWINADDQRFLGQDHLYDFGKLVYHAYGHWDLIRRGMYEAKRVPSAENGDAVYRLPHSSADFRTQNEFDVWQHYQGLNRNFFKYLDSEDEFYGMEKGRGWKLRLLFTMASMMISDTPFAVKGGQDADEGQAVTEYVEGTFLLNSFWEQYLAQLESTDPETARTLQRRYQLLLDENFIKSMVAELSERGYSVELSRKIINEHLTRLRQREPVDLSLPKWQSRLKLAAQWLLDERRDRQYDHHLSNLFGEGTQKQTEIDKVTDQFAALMNQAHDRKGVSFFVYSGGSGVGKSEMWKSLTRRYPSQFEKFIMYTTRERRPDETDGVEYHFVTLERLKELNRLGKAQIFWMDKDLAQGISLEDVHRSIEGADGAGKIKVLETTPQITAALKDRYKDKIQTFFVSPFEEAKGARMAEPSIKSISDQPEILKRDENIQKIRDLLDVHKPYKGYDVIIVVTTEESEKQAVQEQFDELFGKDRASRDGATVLAVKIPVSGRGQILDSMLGFEEAMKIEPSLEQDWRSGRKTVGILLNAGDGKRDYPLTGAENGSRGMIGVGGALDSGTPTTILNLTYAVSSLFAPSSRGYVDILYASQIAVPSVDVSVPMKETYPIVKFSNDILNENALTDITIKELGIYELDAKGRVLRMFPKGTYGQTTAQARENFKSAEAKGLHWVYSFGSHRIRLDAYLALRRFFSDPKHGEGLTDGKWSLEPPDMIQALLLLLVDKVPQAEILDGLTAQIKDRSARDKAIDKIQAIFNIYVENPSLFESSFLGLYNIGSDIHWWKQRNPNSILNNALLMVSGLAGRKIEVDKNGQTVSASLDEKTAKESSDLRLLNNITMPVTKATLGSVYVDAQGRYTDTDGVAKTLTAEVMHAGVNIDGVYLKDSIIIGGVLKTGSRAVESLLKDAEGSIDAERSLIVNILASKILKAQNSIVYDVLSDTEQEYVGRVVADIFRETIQDPRFQNGQTRLSEGFDTDGSAIWGQPPLPGNAYSFKDIKQMPVIGSDEVRDRIAKSIKERTSADGARLAVPQAHQHAEDPATKADYDGPTGEYERLSRLWADKKDGLTIADIAGVLSKFDAAGHSKPFYGLTLIDMIEPKADNDAYSALEKMAAVLKSDPSLKDKIAFVDPASFHVTVADVIYQAGTDFEKSQYDRTAEQIDRLFSAHPFPGAKFHIHGFTFYPGAIIAGLSPDTEADYNGVKQFRDAFRKLPVETTGKLYPFLGHITIGYIVKPLSPEEYTHLKIVLGEANQEVGKKNAPVVLSHVELRRFTDMNTYTPHGARLAETKAETPTAQNGAYLWFGQNAWEQDGKTPFAVVPSSDDTLTKAVKDALLLLDRGEVEALHRFQKENKVRRENGEWMELPLPIVLDADIPEAALVTPERIILNEKLLRAPPQILAAVLSHGLRRSIDRFTPNKQPHDAAVFQDTLKIFSSAALRTQFIDWTVSSGLREYFGRDWAAAIPHADRLTRLDTEWSGLSGSDLNELYARFGTGRTPKLQDVREFLVKKGLSPPDAVFAESVMTADWTRKTVLYFVQTVSRKDNIRKVVRVAADPLVDILSTDDASRSRVAGGLRIDVIRDAQNYAAEIIDERRRLRRYRRIYDEIYPTLIGTDGKVRETVKRLKDIAYGRTEKDTQAMAVAADILRAMSQSHPNDELRKELSGTVFDLNTDRPREFEQSTFNYSAMSEDGFTVSWRADGPHRAAKVRVRWSVNGGPVSTDEALTAVTEDGAPVYSWAVPARKGWVHYAFEVQAADGSWKGVATEADREKTDFYANGIIKFQEDQSKRRILGFRPAVFNERLDAEQRPMVDDKGNILIGSFDDVTAQLASIKEQGFDTIYLQALETGAPGEMGPDASPFSALNQSRVSHRLGGMKGLMKLKVEAERLGIRVALDMIPHVSRSDRELPPRTAAWIRDSEGKLVRRAGAPGDDGNSEWFDSSQRNWSDPRNVEDYIAQLTVLARLGFDFRVDVGHMFDTTFPSDPAQDLVTRIWGQIVTAEKVSKKSEDGRTNQVFKTLDLRDENDRPNTVLARIIYEVKKRALEKGHQTAFYAENWHGKEAKLILSGADAVMNPLVKDLWQTIRSEEAAWHFVRTLDYLEGVEARYGGQTIMQINNQDAEVSPADAFGDAAFVAFFAAAFSSKVLFQYIHHSFRRPEDGSIDWTRAFAELWQVPVNNFGPARVVNGQPTPPYPGYDWKSKYRHTQEGLSRNAYFKDLGAFEKMAWELTRRIGGKSVRGLYVGHNRVAGAARIVDDTTAYVGFFHLGSPHAADINFHPQDGMQAGNGLGDFAPDGVWALEEVFNNEDPSVSLDKPGVRQVLTGREIEALGMGPRTPIPSLGFRVFRFKKISDALPEPSQAEYRELLRDSIARYHRYGPKDRFEHSFVAREIKAALEKGPDAFARLFAELSAIVAQNGDTDAGDLSAIFGDLITYRPELKAGLHQALIDAAVTSKIFSPEASELAVKILRSADIGEVVLVSPEAREGADKGGLALYISDLARELAALGIDVTVITPLYQTEKARILKDQKANGIHDTGRTVNVRFGARAEELQVVKIFEAKVDGVRILFLENAAYFTDLAKGAYGQDNAFRMRFARLLSLGALKTIVERNIHAGIIQTNDWTTAYIKPYLEGRERLDGQTLRGFDQLKEARVFSMGHNLQKAYHGRITMEDPTERNRIIREDLGMDPAKDWDVIVTDDEFGKPTINPTFTAIKTADRFMTVSPGYHERSLNPDYNDEFGGIVNLLIWKNNVGAYGGEQNGFSQVLRQKLFLAKMLRDKDINARILKLLDDPEWAKDAPGLRAWLLPIVKDPKGLASFSAKSFMEMGHEAERRLLADIYFKIILPVQKERLQKEVGLETGPGKFVYSMLHRIGPQKGHQLLLADIWSADDPSRLKAQGGDFEDMGFIGDMKNGFDAATAKVVSGYAALHGRASLRAVEVAMLLWPDAQFVIAGPAEKGDFFDSGFADIAKRFPAQFRYVAKQVRQTEPLYELIYSGSTVFGMPSLFEPGGLSQTEAAAYGVPRHLTNRDGLKAGAIILNKGTPQEFSEAFDAFNPVAWLTSLGKHRGLYREDPASWDALRYRALTQDNRWLQSAKNYIEYYRHLVGGEPLPELEKLETDAAIHRAELKGESDPSDELMAAGLLQGARLASSHAEFSNERNAKIHAVIRSKTDKEMIFLLKRLVGLPLGSMAAFKLGRFDQKEKDAIAVLAGDLSPFDWTLKMSIDGDSGKPLPPPAVNEDTIYKIALLLQSSASEPVINEMMNKIAPVRPSGARLAEAPSGKSWVEENAPNLAGKKIAEVTMEMALSGEMLERLEQKLAEDRSLTPEQRDEEMRKAAMSTSVGGIGPLLKERLIAQGELGADVVGVSLLYDHVYVQKTLPDGTMVHVKESVTSHLQELLEPAGEVSISMYDGMPIKVKVLKAPAGTYGKGTQYFLSVGDITETIGGRAMVVYAGKSDVGARQKEAVEFNQRWILGRGTLALMKMLGQAPDLIVMSETAAMFAHHRVFRDQFSKDPFFDRTNYVFNDHTPLQYAHPKFDEATLKLLKVDPRYYDAAAVSIEDKSIPVWDETTGKVDMTALIINASDIVFGVAAKHAAVMRAMPGLEQFGNKIRSVTNGVSAAYWPQDDFRDPEAVQLMDDERILATKQKHRERLIRWLAKRQKLGEAWAEKVIREGNPIGVWTRRIVEYKRLERFADVLENETMKEEFLKTGIIFVMGGRIHQDDGYGFAQYNRIQGAIARDPRLKERVIFFENYNIWEAPRLFQGADFSVMLADDGREASATGFQKAQMNGALIIASHDGAVPESVNFFNGQNAASANGFNVPYNKDGQPTAQGLLNGLTQFARVHADKPLLAQMIRNAVGRTSFVSVDRTAREMLKLFSDGLADLKKERDDAEKGRALAGEVIARSGISKPEAARVLTRLGHSRSRFTWRYKKSAKKDTVIMESAPGLSGFIASFRLIRRLGSVGQWSLMFHSRNHDGRGDILSYLSDDLLKGIPYLTPLRTEIASLITQYRATDNLGEKSHLNRVAMALVTHFLRHLEMIAESRQLSWWQDPGKAHVVMSLPIWALRRETNDPGIGKFTDIVPYFRSEFLSSGVNVAQLTPHYEMADESPYAPVSVYALNEDYVDWAVAAGLVRAGPEIRSWLDEQLTVDPERGRSVDYATVRVRNKAMRDRLFEEFRSGKTSADRSLAEDYEQFKKKHAAWLNDYADFMAAKSGEPGDAEKHRFAQWIAYLQFKAAVDGIHAAGGKVLFDIPMFRAKDSLDVKLHPEYFRDVETRNPGIVNKYVHEDWKDVALWNWTKLKENNFRFQTDVIDHWLAFGLDGARNDALHFAYDFAEKGQLASGDEPGDAYLQAVSDVFDRYNAVPLAEFFEFDPETATQFGFIVQHGNLQTMGMPDDPRSARTEAQFIQTFNNLLTSSVYATDSSRFIHMTLGDPWGETAPVKTRRDGRSFFQYRIPLRTDPDYDQRVRFKSGRVQEHMYRTMAFYHFLLETPFVSGVWERPEALSQRLQEAAALFIKSGPIRSWASSLDWFQYEWGRDTFISLPGLFLATGRYEEAKSVIRRFSRFERNGLIPNRIPDVDRTETIEYNTIDAPMWFIQAVKQYVEASGDTAFATEMLPTLRSIISNYIKGTSFERGETERRVFMDTDALISGPAQATWMDADPTGNSPITPRNGKAVEINALWYSNLRYAAGLLERSGQDAGQAAEWRSLADRAKVSFNEKFWNPDERALYDVIDGDPHKGAIRPNMIFAVSHGGDLLSAQRRAEVFASVTDDLLTPYGLRTLSPRDSHYHGRYYTELEMVKKDPAYHQGTVWPWLIGPYVDALVRVRTEEARSPEQIKAEIKKVLTPLVVYLMTDPYRSLPEVFDGDMAKYPGDMPQRPGGTRSQAWSVAEVLRVAVNYGLIEKTTGARLSKTSVHEISFRNMSLVEEAAVAPIVSSADNVKILELIAPHGAITIAKTGRLAHSSWGLVTEPNRESFSEKFGFDVKNGYVIFLAKDWPEAGGSEALRKSMIANELMGILQSLKGVMPERAFSELQQALDAAYSEDAAKLEYARILSGAIEEYWQVRFAQEKKLSETVASLRALHEIRNADAFEKGSAAGPVFYADSYLIKVLAFEGIVTEAQLVEARERLLAAENYGLSREEKLDIQKVVDATIAPYLRPDTPEWLDPAWFIDMFNIHYGLMARHFPVIAGPGARLAVEVSGDAEKVLRTELAALKEGERRRLRFAVSDAAQAEFLELFGFTEDAEFSEQTERTLLEALRPERVLRAGLMTGENRRVSVEFKGPVTIGDREVREIRIGFTTSFFALGKAIQNLPHLDAKAFEALRNELAVTHRARFEAGTLRRLFVLKDARAKETLRSAAKELLETELPAGSLASEDEPLVTAQPVSAVPAEEAEKAKREAFLYAASELAMVRADERVKALRAFMQETYDKIGDKYKDHFADFAQLSSKARSYAASDKADSNNARKFLRELAKSRSGVNAQIRIFDILAGEIGLGLSQDMKPLNLWNLFLYQIARAHHRIGNRFYESGLLSLEKLSGSELVPQVVEREAATGLTPAETAAGLGELAGTIETLVSSYRRDYTGALSIGETLGAAYAESAERIRSLANEISGQTQVSDEMKDRMKDLLVHDLGPLYMLEHQMAWYAPDGDGASRRLVLRDTAEHERMLESVKKLFAAAGWQDIDIAKIFDKGGPERSAYPEAVLTRDASSATLSWHYSEPAFPVQEAIDFILSQPTAASEEVMARVEHPQADVMAAVPVDGGHKIIDLAVTRNFIQRHRPRLTINGWVYRPNGDRIEVAALSGAERFETEDKGLRDYLEFKIQTALISIMIHREKQPEVSTQSLQALLGVPHDYSVTFTGSMVRVPFAFKQDAVIERSTGTVYAQGFPRAQKSFIHQAELTARVALAIARQAARGETAPLLKLPSITEVYEDRSMIRSGEQIGARLADMPRLFWDIGKTFTENGYEFKTIDATSAALIRRERLGPAEELYYRIDLIGNTFKFDQTFVRGAVRRRQVLSFGRDKTDFMNYYTGATFIHKGPNPLLGVALDNTGRVYAIVTDAFYAALVEDSVGRRFKDSAARIVSVSQATSRPFIFITVAPGGARLAETPKILIGVRNNEVRDAVEKALGPREDVKILAVGPTAHAVDILSKKAERLGITETLFIDENDLNIEAKLELVRFVNRVDIELRPVLSQVLNGQKELSELSAEEQAAVEKTVFELLPRLAPRTLAEKKNPTTAEALLQIRLRLFHPSFGYAFSLPPVNRPEAPRAAVWTLANIVDDPFFFETNADRDQKLNGRLTIDDYVVVRPGEDLRTRLGDRYDAFTEKFRDRILKTDSAQPGSLFEMLKGRYDRGNVLFVDRETAQTLKEDPSLKVLVVRGKYAGIVDKVVAEILARSGDLEGFFVPGLEKLGNWLVFSPVVPVDYERQFRSFYEAVTAVGQAA